MAINDRTRARYGICLSDSCPKCKDKTIQVITGRKEFVCEECGKQLREVPRPRTKWEKHGKKIIGGIVAVAVIGGAGAFFALGGEKDEPRQKPVPVQVNQKGPGADAVDEASDAVTAEPGAGKAETNGAKAETNAAKAEANAAKAEAKPEKAEAKPEKAEPKVQNGYGTVNLGYGTYKGDVKNGKPHGHGTITYKASHKIVASKDFVANPGDTYEGDFRDGVVSGGIGYWKHDGDITAVKP